MSDILKSLEKVKATVARHLPEGLPRPADAEVWESIGTLADTVSAIRQALSNNVTETPDYVNHTIVPITQHYYTITTVTTLDGEVVGVDGYLTFGDVKVFGVGAILGRKEVEVDMNGVREQLGAEMEVHFSIHYVRENGFTPLSGKSKEVAKALHDMGVSFQVSESPEDMVARLKARQDNLRFFPGQSGGEIDLDDFGPDDIPY